jgi:hypothetical protein
MDFSLQYTTDSKDGPSFRMTSNTQGWVEYLNTVGQVYYFSGLSQQTCKSKLQQLIANMPQYLKNLDNGDYLGWLNHLAHQRLHDKFILPIFGSVDSLTGLQYIQCGNSRVNACIMCGIPGEEIPMIGFSASRKQLPIPSERLTSTEQFNKIFELENVDYRLTFGFEKTNPPEINFMNSVLRHTVYERPPEISSYYSAKTKDCIDFWKQFQTPDEKFELQIHCTPQTRSLIIPSNLFDIEYIEKKSAEWELSYGMMLGAFNEKSRNSQNESKLQLWLYDVTEPVNLELMIPWVTHEHNFYKTQNEKAVIIYGKNQSNGLQVIGNWVK